MGLATAVQGHLDVDRASPSAHAVFAVRWGEANVSILWWALFALFAAYILNATIYGSWIYATGATLAGRARRRRSGRRG